MLTAFGDKHNIPGPWFENMVKMKWKEWPGLGLVRMYGHDIAQNRNQMVEVALATDCEWFLWLDSDQITPKGIIWRLLSWGEKIVAACVFKKEPQSGFMPVFLKRSKLPTLDSEYDVAFGDVLRYLYKHMDVPSAEESGILLPPTGALLELDAVGFGCVLTHRSIFEELSPPWFAWKDFSEDLYFCRRAKKHGYKIFGDMGAIVGHVTKATVGHRSFLGRYAQYIGKMEQLESMDLNKVAEAIQRNRVEEGKTDWIRMMNEAEEVK